MSQHQFTAHDGARIVAETYGDPRAALTVVLGHCWTADRHDWHYQVTALLDAFGRDIHILTWDHRGHGESQRSATKDCTIATLAADLGGLIDEFAPEGRLVMAGHSIGGMTMMELAASRPDIMTRVDGAAFVSTAASGLSTVTLGLPEMGPFLRERIPFVLAARARTLSITRRRRAPIIERRVARMGLFGRPARTRDVGLYVDQLVNCPAETMEGYFRSCMQHDRVDALKNFHDIPTVVLVGSHDRLTPKRFAKEIADNIAGARLIVAPGAGHMLPLERNELVSQLLAALVTQALDRAATAAA